MEKSTPIGLAAGFVLVWGAIFMGTGWMTFLDIASLMLTIGGTIAALLVAFPFSDVKRVPGLVKGCFSYQPADLAKYVQDFTELSRVARREGLLALDRRLGEVTDSFMSFGLEMAVDGIEESEIGDLMMERLGAETQKQGLGSKFFNTAGTYFPAFGMVGTLIGLIQMMQNLSDPSQIGSGMAVAMVTTFWGAFLANLVCLPIANKMKVQANEMLKARTMVRTGVLSIVRGESPSMVEKRLLLFLGEDAAKGAAVEATPLSKAA